MEHALFYTITFAIGIALSAMESRLFPHVIPIQFLFAFPALAFAVRRFYPDYRMTGEDVGGLVTIALISGCAIMIPTLIIARIRNLELLQLIPFWIGVKWLLAPPLYVIPPLSERPATTALRESWQILRGKRWWSVFLAASAPAGACYAIARVLGHHIVVSTWTSDPVAGGMLAAACTYACWLVGILWMQLVTTALAVEWLPDEASSRG